MKLTQEQIDKFQMIADAFAGKIEIEICLENPDKWIKYEVGNYQFYLTDVMDNILNYPSKIRIAKKIPMLSDDDARFCEWLPKDQWITRDENGELRLHKFYPRKDFSTTKWISQSFIGINLYTFPKFDSITWGKDEVYTIQELLDNYNREKGK